MSKEFPVETNTDSFRQVKASKRQRSIKQVLPDFTTSSFKECRAASRAAENPLSKRNHIKRTRFLFINGDDNGA